MGTRIRIPGLIDVLIVSRPGEILACAEHPALDRGPTRLGPIGNRLIQGIAARTLRTDRRALPSAQPRDDAGRQAAQAKLAGRLGRGSDAADRETLAAIAAWVRGGDGALGPLCQTAIGRLFVPGFTATGQTWRAAQVLDRSLSSRNPLLRLLWRLTDEVGFAQRTLSQAMGGDPAAVHAIGVAVHTFARAVARLDAQLADPDRRATISDTAAIGAAMAAPDTVLRHATAHAETAAGRVSPGTVVMLRLDDATRRSADPRIAFLSESWSACPAHRLVPVLLAEIWSLATAATGPGGAARAT